MEKLQVKTNYFLHQKREQKDLSIFNKFYNSNWSVCLDVNIPQRIQRLKTDLSDKKSEEECCWAKWNIVYLPQGSRPNPSFHLLLLSAIQKYNRCKKCNIFHRRRHTDRQMNHITYQKVYLLTFVNEGCK